MAGNSLATCRKYKDFFRGCRLVYKQGYRFELVETCLQIDNGQGGKVYAHSIYHRTQRWSLFDPFEVIYHALFAPSTDLWVPSTMAAERLGFPVKKHRELKAVFREEEGHLIDLRSKLLKVLHLREIPHNKRGSKQCRRRSLTGSATA